MKKLGPYLLNEVYAVDCLEGMRNLPAGSIDLAIADPPYNLSKGNKWAWDNSVKLAGFGGNWEKVMAAWDDMPLADYFKFTIQWLGELKRVVRPTGSIWIHGTYHNIGIINFALQALEVEIINEVVWYKRNSFPNLSGRRLTASHETILWAHTGKKRKYYFDYEKAKRMACPEDGLKIPNKQMRTVWDVPNNKDSREIKYGKHPAQKPVRLLKRMIELSTKEGQVCLVPFAGIGSECIAAKECGLKFIAFERDKRYVQICQKRLADCNSLFGTSDNDIGQPRPPMIPRVNKSDENPSATQKAVNIPSLIKWTGSKRSQANSIFANFPAYNNYYEPFLGGGALLFLVTKPGAVASDLYSPLINLWRIVQEKPDYLVENYRTQWRALQKNLPEYYYQVRKHFNDNPNPLDLNFLMRTCVNGIVRFNRNGKFNNSFHLSRRGMKPDRFEKIVRQWNQRIQGVKFLCQDYTKTIGLSKKGDFVYFDPPYAGNRQRYTANLDINHFFEVLDDLNRRGVKWALSFDGKRGVDDLSYPVPQKLFKRHLLLKSGHSTSGKVLNRSLQQVHESLYLNY